MHFEFIGWLNILRSSQQTRELCFEVLKAKAKSFSPGDESNKIIDLFRVVCSLHLDEAIADVMTILVYLDQIEIHYGLLSVRPEYVRIFYQFRRYKYYFDPIPRGGKTDHWIVRPSKCSRCFQNVSPDASECLFWNRKLCRFCALMTYCRCGRGSVLYAIRNIGNIENAFNE